MLAPMFIIEVSAWTSGDARCRYRKREDLRPARFSATLASYAHCSLMRSFVSQQSKARRSLSFFIKVFELCYALCWYFFRRFRIAYGAN